MIGGMTVFANPGADTGYVRRDAEPQVMDVAEAEPNENLIQG